MDKKIIKAYLHNTEYNNSTVYQMYPELIDFIETLSTKSSEKFLKPSFYDKEVFFQFLQPDDWYFDLSMLMKFLIAKFKSEFKFKVKNDIAKLTPIDKSKLPLEIEYFSKLVFNNLTRHSLNIKLI